MDKLTKLIEMYVTFDHLELKNDDTINVQLIIKYVEEIMFETKFLMYKN